MQYEDIEIEKARKLFSGECKFIAAALKANAIPIEECNEIAFAGRSNVGKSSLVNALTNRKTLARTSQTPGRTRQLIFFELSHQLTKLRLVDLPGYGYAKASKREKKEFQKLITDYFAYRKQLVNAFILVDVRHEAQEIDIEFMKWLTTNNIAFSIVFTKIDKLKQNGNPNEGVEYKIQEYKKVVLESWEYLPKIFLTSSAKHIGKENIISYINDLNKQQKTVK